MKVIVVIILLFILFLAAHARASGKAPAVGDIYRSYKVDLNNDGYLETVDLIIYAVKDEGWYGRLVVRDRKMNLIWSSPGSTKTVNQLLFGSWDWGSSIPEVIGIIDGEAKVKMLTPAPVSDVRPVPFRIYRWTGSGFKFLSQRALVVSPEDPLQFDWTATPNYEGCWVDGFEKLLSNETCLVRIREYKSGYEQCRQGKAIIRSNLKGYHVVRWVEPLKSPAQ